MRAKRGPDNTVRDSSTPARNDKSLHLAAFAEIKLTADRIVDEKIFRAFAFDPALVDQLGTIDDRDGLAHVMVGDENSEAEIAQVNDDLLHIVNGNRINTAEWFVQHQQFRFRDQ